MLSRVGLRCEGVGSLRDGYLLVRLIEVAGDAGASPLCGHPVAPKRPSCLRDTADLCDVATDMLTAAGCPPTEPLFPCACPAVPLWLALPPSTAARVFFILGLF